MGAYLFACKAWTRSQLLTDSALVVRGMTRLLAQMVWRPRTHKKLWAAIAKKIAEKGEGVDE